MTLTAHRTALLNRPESVQLNDLRISVPEILEAHVEIRNRAFLQSMWDLVADAPEPDVYFYHSDHLGSASWITDANGEAVQHLQYLPYGEPYINQRTTGYNERFTFTGKERDEETGYGYFGARYMDHELMTMWLSVDPMADKYPSLSPYNYCAWNPIRLIDPDGRDFDPETEKKYVKKYEEEVKTRMNTINSRRDTKQWKKEYNEQYEEYQQILTEIDKLRNDPNNVYSIQPDETLKTNGKLVYGGERSDGKRSIQIKLAKREGMSTVAHELKHAYQYYEDRLGFVLDQSGKQVSSNNCKIFEREAFTRGNMFSDVLLTNGGRLKIYNLDPEKYIFQHGSKYEKFQEYPGIHLLPGQTYITRTR